MPIETRRKSALMTTTSPQMRITRNISHSPSIARRTRRVKSLPYEGSIPDDYEKVIEIPFDSTPVPDLIEQAQSPPMYDIDDHIDRQERTRSDSHDDSIMVNSELEDDSGSVSILDSIECHREKHAATSTNLNSSRKKRRPVRGCRYVPHNGLKPSAVDLVEATNQSRVKRYSATGITKPSQYSIPITTPYKTTSVAHTRSLTDSMAVPSILVAPTLDDFEDADEGTAINSNDASIEFGGALGGLDTESMGLDDATLLAGLLMIPTTSGNAMDDSTAITAVAPELLPGSKRSRWRTQSESLAASDFLGGNLWKPLLENDTLQETEKGFYESFIHQGWRGNKSVAKACVASWVSTNEQWADRVRRASLIVDVATSNSNEDTKMEDYVVLNGSDNLVLGTEMIQPHFEE